MIDYNDDVDKSDNDDYDDDHYDNYDYDVYDDDFNDEDDTGERSMTGDSVWGQSQRKSKYKGEGGFDEIGQTQTKGEGVFMQCRCPGVQNATTRQHLRITRYKKMAMKTVTRVEADSHDDHIAMIDIAPIGDIATSMKQPFTQTDFLHVK